MRYKLSSKCVRELKKNTSVFNAARAFAEKACEGTSGIGRGNCMTANFDKYAVDNVQKFCPNDPQAVVPLTYGFEPKSLFRTGGGKWYANSDGYGGDTISSLVTMASSSASKTEATGRSHDQIQKYLMFGAGAFLLLALVKPAVMKSK